MKQILEDKTAHPIRVFEDNDKYLIETTLLPTFHFSPPSKFRDRTVGLIFSSLLGSLIVFIFIKVGNYDHYYAEFFIFAGIPILFFFSSVQLLFGKPKENYQEYNSSQIFDLTYRNNKEFSFFFYKNQKELHIYIKNNYFRKFNMESGNIFLYDGVNYSEKAIHYRGGINHTLVKYTLRIAPRKTHPQEHGNREMEALIPILNYVHALAFADTPKHSNVSNDSTVKQDQVDQKNINPMD